MKKKQREFIYATGVICISIIDQNQLLSDPDPTSHVHSDPNPASHDHSDPDPESNRIRISLDLDKNFQIILKSKVLF
jgi:hypothetical protein